MFMFFFHLVIMFKRILRAYDINWLRLKNYFEYFGLKEAHIKRQKIITCSFFRAIFAVRYQLTQYIPHVLIVGISFDGVRFLLTFSLYYLIDCQLEGVIEHSRD
jgi:hypothetical protein